MYRYKCRLYQPGSPSDKSDSLTGRGCCTGVGPFLWWLPVMQHSLSLHRIQPPIAMKLSAEQYKLCALLVRAARQCAAHFAAGACLCTACNICNTCTACALPAIFAIFALLALLVHCLQYLHCLHCLCTACIDCNIFTVCSLYWLLLVILVKCIKHTLPVPTTKYNIAVILINSER